MEVIQGDLVLDLKDVRKDMIELAGGKGANLGELISIGVRVPPGFVLPLGPLNISLIIINLLTKYLKFLRHLRTKRKQVPRLKS